MSAVATETAPPRRSESQAGGKLILLGEHAVVHGQPAIATGLPCGVRVAIRARDDGLRTVEGSEPRDLRLARAIRIAAERVGVAPSWGFDLSIRADLPDAVGLGSSASLSVALARALVSVAGGDGSAGVIAEVAHAVEGAFHGTPSGVDVTTVLDGGLGWYEVGPPRRWETIVPAVPLDLVVVVADRRHDTGRTVGSLRERSSARPGLYHPIFEAIGGLVREGRHAIESGDLARLGEAMTLDHGLLRTCGVSTPALDAAVEEALATGALGAKLTGGGGGGAIVALAPGRAGDLAARLDRPGRSAFPVRVPTEASGTAGSAGDRRSLDGAVGRG